MTESRRKKAICKDEFLKGYRNYKRLDLERLVVVDEDQDCWEPQEFVDSLPQKETALTAQGLKNRQKMSRRFDEFAEGYGEQTKDPN